MTARAEYPSPRPMPTSVTTISVLVPTYRRPADLRRCFAALARQTRPAEEILVVMRPDDDETRDVLSDPNWADLPLRAVLVTQAGQVAALNAGLEASDGDLIAITDDDAAPHPDWLHRIEQHFDADPALGGLGGRDYIQPPRAHEPAGVRTVGRLSWFGRTVGLHHLGIGGPRDVHMVKGVNMSFRWTAIAGLRFDTALRGSGAQPRNDYMFSTAVRRAGWRLVYDPAVAVDHYAAERVEGDARLPLSAEQVYNSVFNETLFVLRSLSTLQQPVFLLWAVLVGHIAAPGVVQAVRWRLHGRGDGWQALRSALRARRDAWSTFRRWAP